jgi:hypothetical protein
MTPESWEDVVEAVSGGPLLIKDGIYCIDSQAENFCRNWTSKTVQARTACGITADNHLLLATLEGPHTLFDMAYILHELGAVEAMNLDGGGSTTMVIHNAAVNMESKSNERRVAAVLGIFEASNKGNIPYNIPCRYIPSQQLPDPINDSTREQFLFTAQNPLENQPVVIRKAL